MIDYSHVQADRDQLVRERVSAEGREFAMRGALSDLRVTAAAWVSYKAADGWRYGPFKDPVAKTHPCMVPYDKLPPEQRVKDASTSATR